MYVCAGGRCAVPPAKLKHKLKHVKLREREKLKIIGGTQLFWFVPTGEVLRNTLAPAAAQVTAASMPAGRRLHVAGEYFMV